MTTSTESPRATGRCLCGGVEYVIRGPLRAPLECHCRSCRKATGGLWHATAARREAVEYRRRDSLKWYASSPTGKRGFCGICGSKLFFDREDNEYLSIAMGPLTEPTGLRLAVRSRTASAADYYVFADDIPKIDDANHPLFKPENWPAGRGSGSCNCGKVSYRIEGPMRPLVECHCTLCRRSTGGLWHATAALRENIEIDGGEGLTWYEAKPGAQRGFCATCGTSMFVDGQGRPHLTVTAGTLDEPTGLRLTLRIFVANTGDYQVFGEDAPSHPERYVPPFAEG